MLVLISYEHAPVKLAHAESVDELAKWWVGLIRKGLHVLFPLA